jgi:hypothetical protein
MYQRRTLLKFGSAALLPAAAAAISTGVARADDGGVKEFLGAWDTIHSLPFPPGQFREFLSFADGGVLHETNSFLHTASNLDLSMLGLPNLVNAADGVGNWRRVAKGVVEVILRKMLFDGARQNFGDLRATGRLTSDGVTIFGTWNVEIVLPNLTIPQGPATTEGKRLA